MQRNQTDFFVLRRKDCLTRSTLSSDTRGRPALFPLQRHPVVWNCWYQRLMLLGDGGSLLNCCRNARWTETTDSCFTNCSTQNTLHSAVAIVTLLHHRPRKLWSMIVWHRGEWDCACAQSLNTCCFIPCWAQIIYLATLLTPGCRRQERPDSQFRRWYLYASLDVTFLPTAPIPVSGGWFDGNSFRLS